LVFPNHPVNLLSVRCIKVHGNYITTKDSYQIVNRKSGEVVTEGVSIRKMYALKQSIPNILYKDIIETLNRRKHLWLKFLCRHDMNDLDISTLGD
jgi:hypothetical protein